MITDTVLQAIPREDRGKNDARRLRAAGRVPAALYGEGAGAASISINARELGAILRSEAGRNAIFTLAVDGVESTPVRIQELKVDPVSSRLVHLDFLRISMTSKIRVSVPLEFVGEAKGVKIGGGMFEVHVHNIELECLPRDIPSSVTVDISEMELGDHLQVNQLAVDTGTVTVITGGDHLVAAVVAARVVAETTPEEIKAE